MHIGIYCRGSARIKVYSVYSRLQLNRAKTPFELYPILQRTSYTLVGSIDGA